MRRSSSKMRRRGCGSCKQRAATGAPARSRSSRHARLAPADTWPPLPWLRCRFGQPLQQRAGLQLLGGLLLAHPAAVGPPGPAAARRGGRRRGGRRRHGRGTACAAGAAWRGQPASDGAGEERWWGWGGGVGGGGGGRRRRLGGPARLHASPASPFSAVWLSSSSRQREAHHGVPGHPVPTTPTYLCALPPSLHVCGRSHRLARATARTPPPPQPQQEQQEQ